MLSIEMKYYVLIFLLLLCVPSLLPEFLVQIWEETAGGEKRELV